MARIMGLPAHQAGWLMRQIYRYAQRTFGKVPEPLTIVAHHASLARGNAAFEFFLARSRLVKLRLKALASIQTATMVGCPF